jgi:hypothetical protein
MGRLVDAKQPGGRALAAELNAALFGSLNAGRAARPD